MAKAFKTNRDVARIERSVLHTERQRRRASKPPGLESAVFAPETREFQLAETLEPKKTADAYRLIYSGDGDTCETSDFTADTDGDTFKVGGGAMDALRLRTFAIGTRGQCRKDPGRNWWTIFQIDCTPTES